MSQILMLQSVLRAWRAGEAGRMLEAGRRYSDAPTAGISLGPIDAAVLARLVSDGLARYDTAAVSVVGEAVAPGGFVRGGAPLGPARPSLTPDGALIDPATGASLASPVFTWDSVTTDYAGRIQVFLSSAAENGTPVSFQKAIYPVGTGIVLSSGSLDADFGGATLQRISGTIANGPTTQIIKLTGMVGAKIKRLKIDGNKDADGLSGANYSDRCGGLVLDTCSYCEIYDVEIVRTTNGEDTAGLYPVNCFRCDFVKIRASYNDRTAIYPCGCDACSFIDVYTHHNLGTGLGGRDSDDCIYRNLISHDEGYSQISLNGKRAIVDNVLSYNSPANYAAIVLGHDTDGSRADGTVASNIVVRDCAGWGICVQGSSDVKITNYSVERCADVGVRIFNNNSSVQLYNGSIKDGTLRGMSIETGRGNKIAGLTVHGQGGGGIAVLSGVTECSLRDITAYNNGAIVSGGSFGVLLEGAITCRLSGFRFFDNQTTKTQETGLYISGGSGHVIEAGQSSGNKTYQLREVGAPSGVTYSKVKTSSADAMAGTITTTASAATATVTNANAQAISRIRVWPTNAAGVANSAYVSAVTAGTSFVVTLTSPAIGTETYAYEII